MNSYERIYNLLIEAKTPLGIIRTPEGEPRVEPTAGAWRGGGGTRRTIVRKLRSGEDTGGRQRPHNPFGPDRDLPDISPGRTVDVAHNPDPELLKLRLKAKRAALAADPRSGHPLQRGGGRMGKAHKAASQARGRMP